jgi:xylulokinase
LAHLLGLDIGTSGTKGVIIDENGVVVGRSVAEYPLHIPRPLWAEQDPADWWRGACEAARGAIADAGLGSGDIGGVGLSGQMHGSVFLDGSDNVIRPAILWCDQRTAAQCEWIDRQVGHDKVLAETANPVLTGFQAPKIVWLRDEEPGNFAKVKSVLLPKDYVRLLMTGERATDVSDASGTSLLNVPKRDWSQVMLQGADIPREWLPPVFESQEITGRVTESAAAAMGLAAGTPVVAGTGDQAGGAVGNGIVKPGVVSSTVGTSGVVFAFSDKPTMDPQGRVHTFCHAVPGKWHVMGVMLSAGGSLRWYRDTLAAPEVEEAKRRGVDPYEVITEGAATVPVGCDGLVFLPYLSGERTPYADPNARGVFFGLTLSHTRNHMARAVLEGVAFGLRDSFEILKEMGVPISEVRASGGGARSALWRSIQASVTGFAHVTINIDEGPAFGVALLAGVGTGAWSTVEEACAATIRVESRTDPAPADRSIYEKLYATYRAVYRQLKEEFVR